MKLLRMAGLAWRLAWPHPLTPWRSPLIRWRLETYGVCDERGRLLSASALDDRRCLRLLMTLRRPLIEFLSWAADLVAASRGS